MWSIALACAALVGCSSPEPREEGSRRRPKNEKAPDVFQVNLDTSKGPVVDRGASRLGADRSRPFLQAGEDRVLR